MCTTVMLSLCDEADAMELMIMAFVVAELPCTSWASSEKVQTEHILAALYFSRSKRDEAMSMRCIIGYGSHSYASERTLNQVVSQLL